jgi:hypothetical protein
LRPFARTAPNCRANNTITGRKTEVAAVRVHANAVHPPPSPLEKFSVE